ncbi:MAG: hypothetical protein IJG52_01955 [Lachnospiraceae bacterium]|nr:hypothetical protein [Lachnospiraceae bacterium]MBQ3392157.1 hypothetical protein [Lachnospiraceae bacterium]
MKKTIIIFVAALSLLSACGFEGAKEAKEPESPPALHSIEYDSDLGTLDDALGADAFDHTLDHADSRYYVINDYYNMESGAGTGLSIA